MATRVHRSSIGDLRPGPELLHTGQDPVSWYSRVPVARATAVRCLQSAWPTPPGSSPHACEPQSALGRPPIPARTLFILHRDGSLCAAGVGHFLTGTLAQFPTDARTTRALLARRAASRLAGDPIRPSAGPRHSGIPAPTSRQFPAGDHRGGPSSCLIDPASPRVRRVDETI